MMTKKDLALLEFILEGTAAGTLRWEPTAHEGEFTASLRGFYPVSILRSPGSEPDVLTLRNSNGEVLLQLDARDDNRINGLFPNARRSAYNVDKIIDEIVSGEKKKDDDIPF